MAFQKADDYVEVADRIAQFKGLYPNGSLQPADPAQPYRIEQVGSDIVITYTAAAYREPDDPRPGIGVASEPYPGKTPYTKGSELMNAETSAWGRAIVAVGIPTKRVASANEVRNRTAERGDAPAPAADEPAITTDDFMALAAMAESKGRSLDAIEKNLAAKQGYSGNVAAMPKRIFTALMAGLAKLPDAAGYKAPKPAAEAPTAAEQAAVVQGALDAIGSVNGAATPPAVLAAVEQLAPLVSDADDDGDIPGMGAEEFKAKRAAGPKATKAQLAKLVVMLNLLPEDSWRSEMEYRYGVKSRADLTKDDASSFIEWATTMVEGVPA